jgi:hypothetical protein
METDNSFAIFSIQVPSLLGSDLEDDYTSGVLINIFFFQSLFYFFYQINQKFCVMAQTLFQI